MTFSREQTEGKSKPKAERAYSIVCYLFFNIPLYFKLHQEEIFAVSQGSLFLEMQNSSPFPIEFEGPTSLCSDLIE